MMLIFGLDQFIFLILITNFFPSVARPLLLALAFETQASTQARRGT